MSSGILVPHLVLPADVVSTQGDFGMGASAGSSFLEEKLHQPLWERTLSQQMKWGGFNKPPHPRPHPCCAEISWSVSVGSRVRGPRLPPAFSVLDSANLMP